MNCFFELGNQTNLNLYSKRSRSWLLVCVQMERWPNALKKPDQTLDGEMGRRTVYPTRTVPCHFVCIFLLLVQPSAFRKSGILLIFKTYLASLFVSLCDPGPPPWSLKHSKHLTHKTERCPLTLFKQENSCYVYIFSYKVYKTRKVRSVKKKSAT